MTLHLEGAVQRSRGQVIDLFTKKSKTCPSDLSEFTLFYNNFFAFTRLTDNVYTLFQCGVINTFVN